jgi:hypothetical protein
LFFIDCVPMREFIRRADRSTELAALDGQCCPLSNANLGSRVLALAHGLHGLRQHCPDAISHSAGINATNVSFTRSIAIQFCHAL